MGLWILVVHIRRANFDHIAANEHETDKNMHNQLFADLNDSVVPDTYSGWCW